jgi:hypothetical protein
MYLLIFKEFTPYFRNLHYYYIIIIIIITIIIIIIYIISNNILWQWNEI